MTLSNAGGVELLKMPSKVTPSRKTTKESAMKKGVSFEPGTAQAAASNNDVKSTLDALGGLEVIDASSSFDELDQYLLHFSSSGDALLPDWSAMMTTDDDDAKMEKGHDSKSSAPDDQRDGLSSPTSLSSSGSSVEQDDNHNTFNENKQPLSSPGTPSTYAPMNTVHMYLHDNARLPSLGSLKVDRSNSNGRNSKIGPPIRPRPRRLVQPNTTTNNNTPTSTSSTTATTPIAKTTSEDIDEMMRLSEHDMNLTEMFLGSNQRSNAALAYSGSDALLKIGSRIADTTSVVKKETIVENSAGTKQSADVLMETIGDLSTRIETATTTTTAIATAIATTIPILSDPLLLPPQTTASLANPLSATPLSGLASTSSKTSAGIVPPPVPSQAAAAALGHAPHPYAAYPPPPAGSTTAHSFNNRHGYQQAQQQGSAHSAAHRKANSANSSILDATKRRSQLGFGGNHAVPSVPGPPPAFRSQPPSRPRKGAKAIAAALAAARAAAAAAPPPSNSGAAYERKKQRAKDSRIKLNEGIERMGIAMNLTGIQSKQRQKLIKSSARLQQHPKVAGFLPSTLQIMEDCTKCAESAKKWDRPSFINSAATIIEGLNAQCEALVRVLAAFKREETNQLKKETQIDRSVSEEASTAMDSSSAPDAKQQPIVNVAAASSKESTLSQSKVPSPNSLKRQLHVPSSVASMSVSYESRQPEAFKEFDHSPAKRPKYGDGNVHVIRDEEMERAEKSDHKSDVASSSVVDQNETYTLSQLSTDNAGLIRHVLSFLDPFSLAQCMVLSKSWTECNNGAIGYDQSWSDLCTRRFGMASVRSWKGNQDDDDDKKVAPSSAVLYRQMSAANVRPHCHFEGDTKLGGARLGGSVSAWASLVTRSNGETLRSVRGGGMAYKSTPVVELRILVQNTGCAEGPILIKEQSVSVDASTRRRGEEMMEIGSNHDDRFAKVMMNLDGSPLQFAPIIAEDDSNGLRTMCRLRLFDSIVLVAYIHAKGCLTTSKFRLRTNFTKILITMSNGTTVPLVIPFKTIA
eukprot:scaffold4945_cov61-Attheya_sp.AAC.2